MAATDSVEAKGDGAYTVDRFCEKYGIGKTKLYEEMNEGRLKARKLGKKTLIAFSEAERWLNSLPEREAQKPRPPVWRPVSSQNCASFAAEIGEDRLWVKK